MGLLDLTPDQWTAIGLLGNGIAQKNFSGGAVNAMGYLDQAPDRKLKQQYSQMQLANMQSEIEQRAAAVQKQKQLQDMAQRIIGGGGSVPAQAGQMGSGSFGIQPPPQGMPDMPAQRPAGLGGASLNDIVALHAAGGPDLLNAYKLSREGFERKPGTFYEGVNGGREYIGDPTKGFSFNNGQVGVMPGFANANAQITASSELPKAIIGAAGKVNLRPNADGTQSPVTEMSENPLLSPMFQQMFGGGGGAPAAAAQRPALMAPTAPAGRQIVAPGDQRTADAESIRMMQSELQNPRLTPQDRDGIQREISRLTQAQAQPGFPQPSMVRNPQGYGMTNDQAAAAAALKTKAEVDARAASERESGKVKKSDSANDMLGNISRARTLLSMDPTGSVGGAAVDKVLGLGGVVTPSGNVANSLETLSGWLTANVPRMEGPQSNFDVDNYKVMAGRVGDRTVPVKARLAALDEVERIQQKYANGAGAQTQTAQSQPSNLVASLPKTATKGARARDTATGEILQFNGLSWVKAK